MNAQEANKIATETRRKFIETLPLKEEIAACLEQIQKVITSNEGVFKTSYYFQYEVKCEGRKILKDEFIREMMKLGYKVKDEVRYFNIYW